MPDYKTNDPKGWLGDPKRGAALGRPSIHNKEAKSPKLTLRKIRLDNGGYDSNGTYFGVADPLYWCASEDGEIDFMLRASDRKEAKEKVRGSYKDARFY